MSFEWDHEKASLNLKKHDVDFADATTIFEDLNALTLDDHDHEEVRCVSLGMDAQGKEKL